MFQRGPETLPARKGSSGDARRKEKELRKVEADLQREREAHKARTAQLEKELNEAQANLHDEEQKRIALQMELDCKNDEIEQYRLRFKSQNFDTASQNSGSGGFEEDDNQGGKMSHVIGFTV